MHAVWDSDRPRRLSPQYLPCAGYVLENLIANRRLYIQKWAAERYPYGEMYPRRGFPWPAGLPACKKWSILLSSTPTRYGWCKCRMPGNAITQGKCAECHHYHPCPILPTSYWKNAYRTTTVTSFQRCYRVLKFSDNFDVIMQLLGCIIHRRRFERG